MITIRDESELPAPAPFASGRWGYVRSISDRTVVICDRTGEVYQRIGGAGWDNPGYWVSRDGEPRTGAEVGREGKVTCEPATAYGDDGHVPKKIRSVRRKAT